MLDSDYPGHVLYRRQATARARRFQIETAVVSCPDAGKRVFKRALHAEGAAHLQRMAANQQAMRIDQPSILACPCAMHDGMLEMNFVEGISLKQQLLRAIGADDRAGIEALLARYRSLVSTFDARAAELVGPGSQSAIFAGSDEKPDAVVLSGNIDQGFDHWIVQQNRMVLIDYEWVLGFPVPLKYVLYRAAQLFFQDVPPPLSPRFRLRDMCALFSISPQERPLYDRMEAHFQRFVRTDLPGGTA